MEQPDAYHLHKAVFYDDPTSVSRILQARESDMFVKDIHGLVFFQFII